MKKDGGDSDHGVGEGVIPLGVSRPHAPQKLLRVGLIGIVKSNKMTEPLG